MMEIEPFAAHQCTNGFLLTRQRAADGVVRVADDRHDARFPRGVSNCATYVRIVGSMPRLSVGGEMQDYGEDRHAEGDGRDRQEDLNSPVLRLDAILPGTELAGLRPFPHRPLRAAIVMRMMAPDAPQRGRDGDGEHDQPARYNEKLVRIGIAAEAPGRENKHKGKAGEHDIK